jgi:gliding motility-associated-like protein
VSEDCSYTVPAFDELINFYDECSEFSFVQTPEAGTVLYADSLATLIVTDAVGNTSECQFEMLLSNPNPPMVSCPQDDTIELLDNCTAILGDYTLDLAYEARCFSEIIEVSQTPPPGTIISEDTLVTITVMDDQGNESICGVNIILVDNQAPVIICPADILSENSIVTYDLPEVDDNCEVDLTLVSGLESGSSFPHGVSEITYMATDQSGNQSECSFTITVNTPPVALNDTLLMELQVETLNALTNDYDLDGDEFTLISAWAYNDSIDIDFTPFGNIELSINYGWCGLDSVQYIISDTYGALDTGLVVVDNPCFMGIDIPEGFSPNGDGVNDTFVITGIENFPNNKVSILNRWGREVYSAMNYSNEWDGMSSSAFNFGNGNLPSGTYFVILDLGDGSPIIKTYIYLNY